MDQFPVYKLTDFENAINEVIDSGKTPVIFDKSGNVCTFLTYKGTVIEIAKQIIPVRMGAKTPADAIEGCRRVLVQGMRGEINALNLDKLVPDFNGEFKSEDFPIQEIMNIE